MIEKRVCTVKEIATILDLTPRRVQQLAKMGVIPKTGKGKYPLLDCIHKYIRFLRKLVYRFSGGMNPDMVLDTELMDDEALEKSFNEQNKQLEEALRKFEESTKEMGNLISGEIEEL